MVVAEIVATNDGNTPKNLVYRSPADKRFVLYIKGEKLRLRTPARLTTRRLRRFLGLYVRDQGGNIQSVSSWTVPWR